MYKLTNDEYSHLLDNAVTAAYDKATERIKNSINEEGLKYTKRADIFVKIEINDTSNCFLILKDHKEKFVYHSIARLINIAKNDIGRISKSILDKTRIYLYQKLKLNEWENATDIIN